MEDKVRTTIYLERELKHIVENEDLNLSKWVNDSLTKYFSVASVEEIDDKLSSARETIRVLEKKRVDLLAEGISETKTQAVSGAAETELKEVYRARRDCGTALDLDREWLCSPKNLERLKSIGWQVDEAVFNLRGWYGSL